jgi:hypothetical protein
MHTPVISSLFGPNILLSTLFSNTFFLCSYLIVRDQLLLPFKTTGKIVLLYVLIFMSSYDSTIIETDSQHNEHTVFLCGRVEK